MKKLSQVRSKATKRSQNSQYPTAPAAVPNSTDKPRFEIVGSDTGETVHAIAHLTFPRLEFERLRAAYEDYNSVLKIKVGLEDFVMLAIERESNRQLFPGHPLGDIEDAVNESIGLLKLIALASVTLFADDSPLSIGIQNLSSVASRRLERAFNVAHSYAVGKYFPSSAPAVPTPA
jgi:hypothetical protein